MSDGAETPADKSQSIGDSVNIASSAANRSSTLCVGLMTNEEKTVRGEHHQNGTKMVELQESLLMDTPLAATPNALITCTPPASSMLGDSPSGGCIGDVLGEAAPGFIPILEFGSHRPDSHKLQVTSVIARQEPENASHESSVARETSVVADNYSNTPKELKDGRLMPAAIVRDATEGKRKRGDERGDNNRQDESVERSANNSSRVSSPPCKQRWTERREVPDTDDGGRTPEMHDADSKIDDDDDSGKNEEISDDDESEIAQSEGDSKKTEDDEVSPVEIVEVLTSDSRTVYQCSLCQKCFVFRYKCVKHMRTHSKGKPYKCEECGKSYKRREHLTVHQRQHTGERNYQCTLCDSAFLTSWELTQHRMQLHQPDIAYTCGRCGRRFCNHTSFIRHQIRHRRKEGIESFQCEHCGKVYGMDGKALRVIESADEVSQSERNKHCCEECGASFPWPSALALHKKTAHAADKKEIPTDEAEGLSCKKCGKVVSTGGRLQIHMRMHERQEEEADGKVCEFCGKVFPHNGGLYKHRYIHFDKSFHCHLCPKSFHLHQYLKSHMKSSHPNVTLETFKCDKCNRTFHSEEDRVRHEAERHPVDGYRCKTCGRTYRQYRSLTAHITASKQKGLSCNVCGRKFCSNYQLMLHSNTCTSIQGGEAGGSVDGGNTDSLLSSTVASMPATHPLTDVTPSATFASTPSPALTPVTCVEIVGLGPSVSVLSKVSSSILDGAGALELTGANLQRLASNPALPVDFLEMISQTSAMADMSSLSAVALQGGIPIVMTNDITATMLSEHASHGEVPTSASTVLPAPSDAMPVEISPSNPTTSLSESASSGTLNFMLSGGSVDPVLETPPQDIAMEILMQPESSDVMMSLDPPESQPLISTDHLVGPIEPDQNGSDRLDAVDSSELIDNIGSNHEAQHPRDSMLSVATPTDARSTGGLLFF